MVAQREERDMVHGRSFELDSCRKRMRETRGDSVHPGLAVVKCHANEVSRCLPRVALRSPSLGSLCGLAGRRQ